jgi:hypothetical protein
MVIVSAAEAAMEMAIMERPAVVFSTTRADLLESFIFISFYVKFKGHKPSRTSAGLIGATGTCTRIVKVHVVKFNLLEQSNEHAYWRYSDASLKTRRMGVCLKRRFLAEEPTCKKGASKWC